MAVQTLTKRCPHCKLPFPATTEYFRTHKHTSTKLQAWCRQCENEWGRENYHEHHAQELQRSRRYYRTHKVQHSQTMKRYRKTIYGHLREVWEGILRRCNNSNHPRYKDYGGRGIQNKFACFEKFYNFVVKELKADPRGLTIDRIDNNGHYEPSNIRFVSRVENCRNRKR